MTKVKMFGTVAALIAVFAAFQVARGNITKDSGDSKLLLSVKWKPEVLSPQNPMNIKIIVDGFPIPVKPRSLSPWSETMTVAGDAKVQLDAATAHPSAYYLDCFILVDGHSVPHTGFESWTKGHNPGPVQVSCTA